MGVLPMKFNPSEWKTGFCSGRQRTLFLAYTRTECALYLKTNYDTTHLCSPPPRNKGEGSERPLIITAWLVELLCMDRTALTTRWPWAKSAAGILGFRNRLQQSTLVASLYAAVITGGKQWLLIGQKCSSYSPNPSLLARPGKQVPLGSAAGAQAHPLRSFASPVFLVPFLDARWTSLLVHPPSGSAFYAVMTDVGRRRHMISAGGDEVSIRRPAIRRQTRVVSTVSVRSKYFADKNIANVHEMAASARICQWILKS